MKALSISAPASTAIVPAPAACLALAVALLLAVPSPAASDPEFVTAPGGSLDLQDAPSNLTLTVRIGRFLIGRTEVTQREYRRVTGAAPSHYRGDDRPVENVSWWDAIRYCNRRSALERLQPCYDPATGSRLPSCAGYRLPTEAEWKLAAADAKPSRMRATGHTDVRDLLDAFDRSGTAPAASDQPNPLGLHDLHGNVWEWCEDWFNAENMVDAVRDPRGPLRGSARVIRGGSFLTNPARWNKGFRSSQPPDRRSPFTGFRVVRALEPAAPPPAPDEAWLKTYQPKPVGRSPAPQSLLRLEGREITTQDQWRGRADEIRKQWMDVLGSPNLPSKPPAARLQEQVRDLAWNGQLIELSSEPAYPSRVLIVEPARKPAGKLPVVIVPFYDVDTPAGVNLGGRLFTAGNARAFARLAAQHGFLAAAVRWFAEGDGESYDEVVLGLARRHPRCTPLGKWIWDASRLIDYLVSRPDVDPARIGMIGHSLGGKMSLYASAFDRRVAAVVASEPGISLGFSNYGDFWYLGANLRRLPKSSDQHELLGLIAPRPFLLIAGESADGDKSWPFLEAAREVYALGGDPLRMGLINHRSGHSPTPEAVVRSMEWLARFLGPGRTR
ncbi:MAG TPA: SUMF1/EgtB/PvdO family nonheme iron enzyme [Bryobacteraceae bacterium]|jgi:formylglycine-generating enzyme required for sulfatase activity|nr:SUMF1/EgtB/PvdO family nonheme iron enzyme [Bryobacteraceae bacterium]